MLNADDAALEALHKKLWKHVEDQSNNWQSFVYAKEKGFYQGFDEIKIDGWRPSEKRFERYNITNYLSKTKYALDIGCNCGFFAMVVSRYVNNIDGVEINPYLVAIANDTKEFLKVENARFFISSFEEYKTDKKYDVIFSLANDETIDGNTKFTFKEYISKIIQLLANDGYLIFESQATDAYNSKRFEPKFELLKKHFEIVENRIVYSEYPVNVPDRIFLILKNKSSV